MEKKSSNLVIVILALLIVLLAIALLIMFYARTSSEEVATNTNANLNQNVNKLTNTNLNTNLNANTNLNSNLNTNLNANANVNTNLNENSNANTNTNSNTNLNTNLNTNTNSAISLLDNYRLVERDKHNFQIQIPNSWWWQEYVGEGSQNYIFLYGFAQTEEILDLGSPYTIELRVYDKIAQSETYFHHTQDNVSEGTFLNVLKEDGNTVYVLFGKNTTEDTSLTDQKLGEIFDNVAETFKVID